MYITAPANKVVEILSVEITNVSNETNEQIEAVFGRIGTLGTPTATTITPSKAEFGDAAAGSLVKGPVTASEPTYGSSEFGRKGFPSLAGYQYAPIPEERPIIAGGDSFGLKILTTSVSSFDARGIVRFREIG
jgi:hypothetical protein